MRQISALLIVGLSCTLIMAQMRTIPHVTRSGGGFTTTLIMENNSISEQAYTLTPYDADGNMMAAHQGAIPGGQTIQSTTGELFPGLEVAHLAIEASDEVSASASYNFASGPGSPAQVAASASMASRWRLFPGNWSNIFDGIAVVNKGEEATDVWVSHRNAAGDYLNSVRVAQNLAPNAKALYVIGDPNSSAFQSEAGSYFEVTANQHLAMTALRGTLAGSDLGLLWGNAARDLSRTTSKRDEKGVFFIRNGPLYDVTEMMGYQVAVDRMWQMDLQRRCGLGRMGEYLGPDFLRTDRVARAIGYTAEELEAHYAALDRDSQILFRAYADGVNRRIAELNSNPDMLPYEYKVLELDEIESFHYTHLMAWLATLQRNFSLVLNGWGQVVNASKLQDILIDSAFDQELTATKFNDLYWTNDPNAPTMIPADGAKQKKATRPPKPYLMPNAPDFRKAGPEGKARIEAGIELLKQAGAYVKGGSYAWVVSGEKSTTGNPILYSGPQMGATAPSPILEVSIIGDDLTISGMTVPGIPVIILGRTPHHAWSFQVGNSNSFDHYLEFEADFTDARPEIVWTRNMETGVLEPNPWVFNRTARGPIINRQPLLSWKYAMKDYEFNLGPGILAMARAKTLDEFHEAVPHLGASLHICYTDTEGNIAYWMSGRSPVRPDGDWRFPQGLVGDPLEWDAEVIHPIPHDRNTPRGWYAGWNNKAEVGDIDTAAINLYGPFHRSHEITDFFERTDKVSMEDLQELEKFIGGTFSVGSGGNPWSVLRQYFAPVLEANPTPERLQLIEDLDNWHGLYTTPDLPPNELVPIWTLLRDWLFCAMDYTFRDELGPSGANPEEGPGDLLAGVHWLNMFIHAMEGEDSGHPHQYNWFINLKDPDAPQTSDEVILAALDATIASGFQDVRNIYRHSHALLGIIYTPWYFNRSVYTQAVEFDSEGPVRILSQQIMGQSGEIQMGADGEPVYSEHFWSSRDDFEAYILREFPLFDK